MGWTVRDLSGRDQAGDRPISTEADLRAELGRLGGLTPRVVWFGPAGAGFLQVGVGGPWGFVEYRQNEPWRAEAATVAAPARPPDGLPGSVWFECGGQGSEVPAKYLLPARQVAEVVVGVLLSGSLPSWLEWRPS